MIGMPEVLIETPFLGESLPGPDGNDVLSDVLRLFRVTGAALLGGEYSAPWAWDAPSAAEIAALLHPGTTRVVVFHIVAKGRCWLELEGLPRIELEEGDVVGFPQGHAHRMGNGSGAAPFPVVGFFPPAPWAAVPTIRRLGEGEVTRIVCVYLRCDELLFNPFLAGLPPLLLLRAGQGPASAWIDANVRYIVAEAAQARAGSACMMARLTELLFVEILRLHIAGLDRRDVGWLAALEDRYLRRALQAFHGRPERPWSAAALAREVGLSRSALDQRFRRRLGVSPMRYLASWRFQLAAQALLTGEERLATIAARVGYGSEEAFSRAFKRATGSSPAAWRRGRLNRTAVRR